MALTEIVGRPGDGSTRLLWRVARHDAMVTSVAFVDDNRIVSGGIDRAVKLTRVDTGEPADEAVMRLTLRCRGVRYDGVRTDRERRMLAAAAE